MPHCRGLQPRWLRSLLVPAACFSYILPLMGITYASQRGPLFHKTVYFLVQFASELCKLQKTIMFADWLLHWLCDFFMPSWQTSTQLAHIGRKWWDQQQEHQWPTLDKESPCSLPFLLSWHWQLFIPCMNLACKFPYRELVDNGFYTIYVVLTKAVRESTACGFIHGRIFYINDKFNTKKFPESGVIAIQIPALVMSVTREGISWVTVWAVIIDFSERSNSNFPSRKALVTSFPSVTQTRELGDMGEVEGRSALKKGKGLHKREVSPAEDVCWLHHVILLRGHRPHKRSSELGHW